MTIPQQDFVACQYGPRAQDYLSSTVHAQGDDLGQIDAVVRNRTNARVLVGGGGGGHGAYRAAAHAAQVMAVDVTAEMLDVVRHEAAARGLDNVLTRYAPAENLPFADASFDIVISRFSAHHWRNMDAGLREARRVLAPGGQGVFIDIVAPAQALFDTHLQAIEILRDPSHVRDYTPAEWAAGLAQAGFRITGLTPRRLRMEFSSWLARTRTPEAAASGIRYLQQLSTPELQAYFEIEADGSFHIDSATWLVSA